MKKYENPIIEMILFSEDGIRTEEDIMNTSNDHSSGFEEYYEDTNIN